MMRNEATESWETPVSHELLVVDDFRLVGHHNVVEHERIQVEHVDGVAVVSDHVAVVVDYLQ